MKETWASRVMNYLKKIWCSLTSNLFSILIGLIFSPILIGLLSRCESEVVRDTLGFPSKISCKVKPNVDSENKDKFVYDVEIYVNFKNRQDKVGLVLFRTTDAYFIQTESLKINHGFKHLTPQNDLSGKRAIGFYTKYEDANVSDDGKISFVAQYSNRRTDEKCEDFHFLEY